MADTREELLAELLGAPLDGFVAERNRLARERRAAGDRDTAAWLAGLRRPTPHVWAVDQLARRDPRAMRTLANLAGRLGAAQSRAVQGDRDAAREMQELSRELQRAVDEAVRRGMEILRDAGHGTSADTALAMTTSLRAALAGDPADRAALEAGTLLAPVAPGFGFAADSAVETAPYEGGPNTPPYESASKNPPYESAPGLRVQPRPPEAETLRRAEEAAEAADREVFQRRTEQRRADEHVSSLRAQLQALQADLTVAETQSRTAADRVREAVDAARAARREADRLQSTLPPARSDGT